MNGDTWIFLALCGALLVFLLMASFLSKSYSLNNIKSKTVGDGQHGTARWATPKEIGKTYHTVPFRPRRWRKGKELPTEQGLILGSVGGRKRKSKGGFLRKTSRKLLEKLRRPVAGKQKRKSKKKSKVLSKVKKMIEEQGDIRALVDSDDIHCLMIGASGVGKTAFFLYPNLEYACACGMSYLALDTKGDLARNYGAIASRYYGYRVSVIDLRNPTRSDGFNFLTLMNHYMDIARADPSNLAARAKAEKYAKILAKTIIQSLAQLEKNYGKEGAEIICDNCQDTIFGGFSPQSKTAEALSAALGSRTVLSGSVSQGKESSQSLQMMERPLMTPDELKSIPKGEFVVMKTGTHPMRTRLRLFLDWGITFDPDGYRMPERAARKISYVNRDELARNIQNRRENSPYNTEDTK